MKWLHNIPIKRKLVLLILAITGAALVLASGASVAYELFAYRRAMAQSLTVLAEALANNCSAALTFKDLTAAQEMLSTLQGEPHVVGACLYDPTGAEFARYQRDAGKMALPASPGPDGHRFTRVNLEVFRPVMLKDKRIGTLFVAADLDGMKERLRVFSIVAALSVLVALLVALLLSARLQRIISKPILALTNTSQIIHDRQDYSVRAEVHGQDEIGQLTVAFNQMLSSIERVERALRHANEALHAEVVERTRTQEQLRQLNETLEQRVAERAAAAEAANRAKSEFLANMSHELRTPLNSVIGFASVLLKNRSQSLRAEDVTFLERILENGKHLLGLINQILDLSKIEAGKTELEITPIALDVIIPEVLAQFEPQIRGRPVQLLAQMPHPMELIDADAGKLKQVLINLVGNAVKFTAQGSIAVHVEVVPGTRRPQRIEVADTGVGIPAEKLATIFDAFEQADASTARLYGGTGLGLTISRALCELMGFRIEVASEAGRGSTFSIVLSADAGTGPVRSVAAPASVAAARISPSSSISLKNKLVLVIDDEPDSRVLLSRLLEELGCRVAVATSGEEGLRQARQARPDLITVDLLMPGMDGWTVLKTLKADPDLAGIPVVVVSVVASEHSGSVIGAAELLQKPVSRDELQRVVRGSVRPKVLIVEDNEDDRRLLLAYLGDNAIEPRFAVNGREALRALDQSTPDLIILDLAMPEMNGMEFLRALRADPRYDRLPVFVATARDLSVAEMERLGVQVQVVLKKSGDLEKNLAHALSDLLHRPKAAIRDVK